jgi:H+/Cl- antiporter ClcA
VTAAPPGARWRDVRGLLGLYLVAAVLGVAVGAFAVGFLAAVKLVTNLVWHHWPETFADHRGLATIAVCTAGGLLVGSVNRGRTPRGRGDEVHDLRHALEDVDGPVPRPSGLLRLASLGVLSLGFGGALGPEAPLIVMVSGLVGRLRNVLHVAGDQLTQIGVAAALGGLFGAPMAPATILVEGRESSRWLRGVGPGIVAAVAGLWIATVLLPSGVLHPFHAHEVSVPFGVKLLLGLLGAAVGSAAGSLVHVLLPVSHGVAARAARPLVLRGGVGGLVLGAAGALTPLALFSGHHEMQDLLDDPGRSGWALAGIAVLRLVTLLACLATGWFGGEIFPASALGMAAAMAVASPLGADAVTVAGVAGMAAAGAVVLRRPIAAFLLFLVFVPPGYVVVVALAAAVAGGLLSTHVPAAEPVPAR